MTQRHKRLVACIFAFGSVVASIALWTAIVVVTLSPTAREGEASNSVWDGVVGTVDLLVDQVAETVVDQVNFVASAVTEAIVSKETSDDLRPAAIEEPTSDLAQWEISHVYAVSIPSLDIQAPVLLPSMRYWGRQEWNLLEEQMQVGLSHGSVAYPHSTSLGGKGTFFLSGHSSPPSDVAARSDFGKIFARIPELKRGDDIILSAGDQDVTYRVQNSVVVPASATDILRQQDQEGLLKIITCYPIGTTKDRMVVTARLVE